MLLVYPFLTFPTHNEEQRELVKSGRHMWLCGLLLLDDERPPAISDSDSKSYSFGQ